MRKYSKYLSLNIFLLGILFLLPLLFYSIGDSLNAKTIFVCITFLTIFTGFIFQKSQIFTLPDLLLSIILLWFFGNYLFISEVDYSTNFWLYVFYIICVFVLKSNLISTQKQSILKVILTLIVVSCSFQALLSLGQHFKLLPKNNDYFSLTGIFSSPNYLALYLSQGVIILLWKFLFQKNTTKTEKTLLVLLSLFISVIVMAKSRGTFISIVSSTICLLFLYPKSYKFWSALSAGYKKMTIAVMTVFVFLGAIGLYFLNSDSINGRKLILKLGTKNITEKPFFGNGLFSFTSAYNKTKADYFLASEKPWNEIKVANYVNSAFNEYYQSVFEMGFLFFVLLLIFCIVLFKVRIHRISILGIGLVLNSLVWMFFNTAIKNVFLMLTFLLGISLLLAHHKQGKILSQKSVLFFKIGIVLISFLGLFCVTKNTIDKPKTETPNNLFSKFYKNSADNFRLGKKIYKSGLKKEGIQLMEDAFDKTHYPKYGEQLFKFYEKSHQLQKAEKTGEILIGLQPYKLQPRIELAQFLEDKRPQQALLLYQSVINLPVKIESKKATEFKELAKEKINP